MTDLVYKCKIPTLFFTLKLLKRCHCQIYLGKAVIFLVIFLKLYINIRILGLAHNVKHAFFMINSLEDMKLNKVISIQIVKEEEMHDISKNHQLCSDVLSALKISQQTSNACNIKDGANVMTGHNRKD